MKDTRPQPEAAYGKPTVTDLGSLAALTLGGKWNSIADLQSGQPDPAGPGS